VTDPFMIGPPLSFWRRTIASQATESLDPSANVIYLWGSIITPDFDATVSDIDVLVFTAHENDISEVHRFNRALQEASSSRIDLTMVSLEMLDRGELIAPLDRIHPAILFSQFERWTFVWGDEMLHKPLLRSPLEIAAQLQLRIKALRRRLQLHDHHAVDEPWPYVVKEIGFICHALHQLRIGQHPFSYSALELHANAATRHAVDTVIATRRRSWVIDDAAAVRHIAEDLCER